MLKVGDIARCVRPGGWENKVRESANDSFLILSVNEHDPVLFTASYGVLHLRSGQKHDRRMQGRYERR